MRLMILDGDTVANVVRVDPDAIPPEYADAPEAPDGVGVGMVWDGSAYVHPAPTEAQVRAEAARRILAIAPEWKQRNLTAQAAILAKKGEANWTPEERAAWDEGEALWNEIAAIRAASDVIEAMDPIPHDYTADARWT
jgi:hypothetical protein